MEEGSEQELASKQLNFAENFTCLYPWKLFYFSSTFEKAGVLLLCILRAIISALPKNQIIQQEALIQIIIGLFVLALKTAHLFPMSYSFVIQRVLKFCSFLL